MSDMPNYTPPRPSVVLSLDPIGKDNEDLDCIMCLRPKCEFSTTFRCNGRLYTVGLHAGCSKAYRAP